MKVLSKRDPQEKKGRDVMRAVSLSVPGAIVVVLFLLLSLAGSGAPAEEPSSERVSFSLSAWTIQATTIPKLS
jgi:hypothetical protein